MAWSSKGAPVQRVIPELETLGLMTQGGVAQITLNRPNARPLGLAAHAGPQVRGHFRDALAAIMTCSRALVNVSFHAASPALVVSMNSRSLAGMT